MATREEDFKGYLYYKDSNMQDFEKKYVSCLTEGKSLFGDIQGTIAKVVMGHFVTLFYKPEAFGEMHPCWLCVRGIDGNIHYIASPVLLTLGKNGALVDVNEGVLDVFNECVVN